MKDKFIYTFLGSLLIIMILLASQREEIPEIKKHGLERKGSGDVYYLEYQGQWHMIIGHNGLGICPPNVFPLEVRKANKLIEANCPSCPLTKSDPVSNGNYTYDY
jgi:hypothetical protein